jgi:hypothetical protein
MKDTRSIDEMGAGEIKQWIHELVSMVETLRPIKRERSVGYMDWKKTYC